MMTDIYRLDHEHEHALESLLMTEEGGPVGNGVVTCKHVSRIENETIRSLAELGYVVDTDEAVVLTDRGRAVAESIIRRHRLTEVLLDSVLKLDKKRAFDIGCQMEHQLQPELVEAFCTLLGHPTVCPHGLSIPPGPCCKDNRTTVEQQVVPMTDLRPGERGRIVFIKPRSHDRLHRLAALGVSPGVVVDIHQRRPAFCFRFEGTELAIEQDVARDIYVTRLPVDRQDSGRHQFCTD
jgi:DtxR family transcriptional regulator, Mn-dependent transcriptional regulator